MGYRDDYFKNNKSNHGWYKCEHCGKSFRKEDIDVDHIIPQKYGGPDSDWNLQHLCKHDNRSKQAILRDTPGDLVKKNCFITTAVCDNFGKADDCYELTMFRNFRDNWLVKQSDGKSLIDEYYEIAPKIVNKINQLTNANEIYNSIWINYLKPCLKFIENDDNQNCKALYIDMVKNLKEKFLRQSAE